MLIKKDSIVDGKSFSVDGRGFSSRWCDIFIMFLCA